jgi:hypothetical protein
LTFFTTETISPNREITPEGFLLCKEVVIARTGEMLYGQNEVPITPGPDGVIRISRTPEEVFNPESMASMNGKPVTLFHPAADVTPDNWTVLAKGTVQNVRQGSDELLVADVLVTSADAIEELQDEIVEVSCGYDAQYQETSPGYGVQTTIRYNHLALLPGAEGRCGAVCSIGDQKPGELMKKKSFIDRLWKALKAKDQAEFETMFDESEETPAEDPKKEDEPAKDEDDPMAALCARIDALEAAVAALKPTSDEETPAEKKEDEPKEETKDEESEEEKKEDEEAKTADAAAVDIFARAEILNPGIQLPVRDSKAPVKTFKDSLCTLKRKALAAAFADAKTRDAVSPLVAGVELEKLSCQALHQTFVGASELVKKENNKAAVRDAATVNVSNNTANLIEQINKANKEFWSRQ